MFKIMDNPEEVKTPTEEVVEPKEPEEKDAD